MRYLLDTNVLSELRKRPGVADPAVIEWSQSQDLESLAISVVSVLELELGVARVERRDAAQGAILRDWFERAVMVELSDQMLDINRAIARRAALLHVPDPRPERDAYIAATALVHDLTVVTRNVTDFEPMGVRILNPWLPQ